MYTLLIDVCACTGLKRTPFVVCVCVCEDDSFCGVCLYLSPFHFLCLSLPPPPPSSLSLTALRSLSLNNAASWSTGNQSSFMETRGCGIFNVCNDAVCTGGQDRLIECVCTSCTGCFNHCQTGSFALCPKATVTRRPADDNDDDDHIVNMLVNVHRNRKTYWGRGYGGGGVGGSIYLSLQCQHRNDFCIKVGSDESHFNVSLIVRDKVTRQCPQTTTFEDKRRAEADSNRGPSACQPNALPLGQTGSQPQMMMMSWCLMSSDVSWHIRDKLWPMPKHGSVIL